MENARMPEGTHPALVSERVIGVGRNPVAAWWTTLCPFKMYETSTGVIRRLSRFRG